MALNVTSDALSSEFDPYSQSFTLLMPDGTPFNITAQDLEAFSLYNVRISINYASQLGASLMLLIILLLLTKPEKRRAPVFIINVLSLAFNFVRSLLQCLYFTSAFNVPYSYFSGDLSRISRSDYANPLAASIFTLLVLVCIEASLVLQANIVCTTLPTLYRRGVKATTAAVALVAIGFRLALAIANIRLILKASNPNSLQWLGSATNIATTVSICVFCGIFVVKLGAAMRERKKLGMKQFGPVRIIFIMGCQTMVIPGKHDPSCLQVDCSRY